MKGAPRQMLLDSIRSGMRDWFEAYRDPMARQERCLFSVLDRLKDSKIGRERDYASIRTVAQFQRRAPIQHYDDLKPYVDRALAGETDVLSTSPLTGWVQTSGSSGTPRVFPYNEAFDQDWFRNVPLAAHHFVSLLGPRARVMKDGECLIIHGPGDCGRLGRGKTLGTLAFNSGWNARRMVLPMPVVPSPGIQTIADWEERLLQTAAMAVERNLAIATGVTTYYLMFFREIEHAFGGRLFPSVAARNPELARQLETRYAAEGRLKVSDLWPNLTMLNFTGVNPYDYQPWLAEILPGAEIFQGYIGTEGCHGFQYALRDPAMVFSIDSGFFEFIEADEYQKWRLAGGAEPRRLTVADLRSGAEYVVCLSNLMGLACYVIGDLVKIVSTAPLLFLHAGRLNSEVNLGTEKMSMLNMAGAVLAAGQRCRAPAREFLTVGVRETVPHYVTMIDFSVPPSDLAAYATAMEEAVMELNESYRDVRHMKVLGPLQVRRLASGEIERWVAEETRAGRWTAGQTKLPQLTTREALLERFGTAERAQSRIP